MLSCAKFCVFSCATIEVASRIVEGTVQHREVGMGTVRRTQLEKELKDTTAALHAPGRGGGEQFRMAR